MTTLELQDKPGNATYVAKVKVTPEGEIKLIPGETGDACYVGVEVAWYPESVKVTIPRGAPAAITQAYLSGVNRDVIIEIKPTGSVAPEDYDGDALLAALEEIGTDSDALGPGDLGKNSGSNET